MAPLRKLLAKAQARLRFWGFEICEKSEIGFVAVFNGGVLNNISQRSLSEFVTKNSKTDSFEVYMPKKSYSILKFNDFESANLFVNFTQSDEYKINGEVLFT